MAFAKLDVAILNSTLWIDRDARDLFITALLMAMPQDYVEPVPQIEVRSLKNTGWEAPAGWYGFVPAAGVGIIKWAGCPLEDGLKGLERLGSPEPDSRSQEFGGRRMIRIDGGYLILNYMKYRERDHSAADRMRRMRERKRAKRDGVTPSRDGEQALAGVTSIRNVTECRGQKHTTDVPSLREGYVVPPVVVAVEAPFQAADNPLVAVERRAVGDPPVVAWSREACDDWISRFGGTAPGGQIGKAMKPLVDRHGWGAVRAAWQSYLGQTEAEYASPTRFASTFGRWSGMTVEPAPRDIRSQTPGQFNAATLQRIQRRLDAKEAERDLGQGRIADGPVEARRVLPGETD